MLSFLHIYFITCLLRDLSIYSFQNRRVRFQATKPGFSFMGFILFCAIFCYVCMFAFVVFVDWLRRTSTKWLILCRVGRKTINQRLL